MKKKILTVSTIFLAGLSAVPVYQAETLEEMEQKQEQLEEKSSEISTEINEKDKKIEALEKDIAKLEAEISTMQKEISELVLKLQKQEKKLTETQERLNQLNEEIKELEKVIAERTEVLNSQARVVQVNGNPQEILAILLDADNITDLYNRASILTTIMGANRSIIHEQKTDQEKLEAKKLEAKADYDAQLALKREIEVSKSNVIAQKSELDEKVANVMETVALTADEKAKLSNKQYEVDIQTEELAKDIEAERKRQEEIKRQEEEARRKAIEAAQAKAAAEASAQDNMSNANPEVNGDGTFIMPASGTFTSYFGGRQYPFGGYDFHLGLDIAGSGSVVAALGGVVERAGYNSSYGYNVIINHGTVNGATIKTLYAHMRPNLSVAAGQPVSQGQQLGIMGSTGDSTGVHLHFEVRRNGQHVDPLGYL